MKYRWQIAEENPLHLERLERELRLPRLLIQCLANRRQTAPESIQTFLEPRLRNLRDPFLIPGMGAAVERLWQARERGEPLVIFGDYDVDGVTTTALLHGFLNRHGWEARHYLPHRFDEGYGLTLEATENCLRQHPVKLLLAVDCGSTAVATITELRRQGVEVVVLDHHQCEAELPPAAALVNPQLARRPEAPAGTPDFTELCSVGLAFKLAHALAKRGREAGAASLLTCDLKAELDLVALGTIADLVPLTGENRILAAAGLERLGGTKRPGLQALKEVAQVGATVGAHEVGFQLGPRVNAAGRLETANEALHLLLAGTSAEANPLARNLDARNRERQAIEKEISTGLIERLRATFNPEADWVIVEGHPDFHLGVVGIVASRVVSEFYRPTIILGGDGENWRGSGRSIEGFDLAAALRECDPLLLRHGGHSFAAGITLKPERVEAFRARLNELARAGLRPAQLQPPLRLDAETNLADLTPDLVRTLEKLGPFGQQNPSVQFCVKSLVNARAPMRIGREQQHLKLWVTDGKHTVEAVWWRGAESAWPTGQFDLAAAPQLNTYNGKTSVQLKVLDWRAAK